MAASLLRKSPGPQAAGQDDAQRLARALVQPRAYPHAPARVEHLETHISHVFLTGPWAYKIKKPLELGFLDFSTLEKRRECCGEELRINRRLAPDLYTDVVPITGSVDQPCVEGSGAAIEYAVKMRQFAQEGMLEQVLARGELTAAVIDAIAQQVADFHAGLAPAGPDTPFGTPQSVMGPARQNFDQLAPMPAAAADGALLDALRQWTEAQHAVLERGVRAAQGGRLRARMSRRPAPGEHGAGGRPRAHLRRHRVQCAVALDRRDQRGRLSRHGPRAASPRRSRLAVPERLPAAHRRLCGCARAALLHGLSGSGARQGRRHPGGPGRAPACASGRRWRRSATATSPWHIGSRHRCAPR